MSFGPGITGPVALACFYLIGGLLVLASLALPGWVQDAGSLLAIGVAAVLSGVGILALHRHLSDGSCQLLVALGSLLVGAAMVAGEGGPATTTYGAFYIWVGMYAALFFAPRPATAHIAWAGTCHVVALVVATEGGRWLAQTVLLFGAITATALVVGALVRQIRTAAATDPLTGLPNRRSFDQHLDMELARAHRADRRVALLALDLDGFKEVNDREGHAAGDQLLVEAGRSWASVLRTGELLARSGGDEFVVLLPDTQHAGARRVAARIAASTPAPLGVSVGIAISEPGDTRDALVRRADEALYVDKAAGRGSVV
jgi:diguanylate cyclase (GGDEF)-like protein